MKHLQRLLVLLTICTGIFSCQKEYSIENNPNNTTITGEWEFKEAGVQFKGAIDTAIIDTLGGYTFLTITGHADDGTNFSLQAFGTQLKPGSYKTPTSLFTYIKGSTSIYATDQAAKDSFTIVITKIDSLGVTGTFSGKALNGTASKSIVDGKFTAVLKSTPVTPPVPTDSGQVVLWSKAGCGGGTSTAAINVTVGGKSGQITSFTTTEPTSCTAAGSFNIKLPAGTYAWVAKCGADSVKGTVTVTKNGCTKQLVDFTAPVVTGDYFPIGINYNWSYLYEASTPDDTLYVLSTGVTVPTTAFGNLSLFTNTYGPTYKDSSYYKKSGGIYYEYLPADSTGTTVVEHVFLKDNVAAGTAWSINTPGGTLQGLTFTGQVRDTLSQKLTSLTVAGKSYTDVLEVHTSYYLVFAAPIGAQQAYSVKQWFAKGVGLIKYYQNDYVYGSGESTMNLTRYKVN